MFGMEIVIYCSMQTTSHFDEYFSPLKRVAKLIITCNNLGILDNINLM